MNVRAHIQRVPNKDLYELFIFHDGPGNTVTALRGGDEAVVVQDDEMIPAALTIPGPLWHGGLKDALAEVVGPSKETAHVEILREWLAGVDEERAMLVQRLIDKALS